MTITCFIRYEIDPFKKDLFKTYADNWGRIVPRLGGHLLGYFVPHEGSNYEAWGLISFSSLAAYEAYRQRLREDDEAVALMAERRTHNAAWANPTRQRLRFARCCYGHLAGQLGVELFSQLLSKEWVAPVGDAYLLTAQGKVGLEALGFSAEGFDKAKASTSQRVAYRCLDWSERRDHMAGKLPKALLTHCLEKGWLRRYAGERALEVTPLGRKQLGGLLPSTNGL